MKKEKIYYYKRITCVKRANHIQYYTNDLVPSNLNIVLSILYDDGKHQILLGVKEKVTLHKLMIK